MEQLFFRSRNVFLRILYYDSSTSMSRLSIDHLAINYDLLIFYSNVLILFLFFKKFYFSTFIKNY